MFGIKMPWTKRKEEAERKRQEKLARERAERIRTLHVSSNPYLGPRSIQQVHVHDDSPSLASVMLMQSMLSQPAYVPPARSPDPEQFVSGGGSADGGGASGDWSSSCSSLSSYASDSSSSYSSSDSSSSYSSSDSSSSSCSSSD